MPGRVCGWCGQPLDYWWVNETANTCEEAYGKICGPALDYESDLQHQREMMEEQERGREEE